MMNDDDGDNNNNNNYKIIFIECFICESLIKSFNIKLSV